MEYSKALKIKELNQHLIGKTYGEFTIDDIIIYPTDSKSFQKFQEIYMESLDAEESIILYMHQDVRAGIVYEQERIVEDDQMLYCDIQDLVDKGLGVVYKVKN